MIQEKRLRVWWIPQAGACDAFFIPVKSPEEGKKIIDLLSAYDCFEYNNNLKADYCNCGGLQQYNEEMEDWEGWSYEDEDSYYDEDDLDLYCEEKSELSEELTAFSEAVLSQVDFGE